MPRSKRNRRSRFEQTLRRSFYLLVGAVVLLILMLGIVISVFKVSPLVGALVFIVAPLVGLIGLAWLWLRMRRSARREAECIRQEGIATAQHIGTLLTGSGMDFELAVADVLRARAYDIGHVGGSRAQGVDLAGTDAAGDRVVVQCKRYGPDNKVGSPEIQRFMGAAVHNGADRGLFITASTYTRQAIALVEASPIPIQSSSMDKGLLDLQSQLARPGYGWG